MRLKNVFIIAIAFLPFAIHAATYTVTNTNDSGSGSLRQAITDANSVFGPDAITFDIPPTDLNYDSTMGVWTITLLSDMPMITSGYVNIDATTQTANRGNTNTQGPEIVLDGGNAHTYAFRIVSPANTVRGFVMGGFSHAMEFYGTMAGQNIVAENYIGTDATGAAAFSNTIGIAFSGNASNITIRDNVISGNTDFGIGLSPASNILITGNMIGTDASGMFALPNGIGIVFDNSPGNTVGGASPAERNIISGNTDGGIVLNGSGSTGNIITGNYIGTNAAGTDSLHNDFGIVINNASQNTIGGTVSGKRNLISGNTQGGVAINGTGSSGNIVIGNFIGTDVSGAQKISNQFGIVITNAGNNIIGGTTAAERNIISGNIDSGILINGTGAEENHVLGNYIGVDVSGLNILDNHVGVLIKTNADKNIIGGTAPGARNVISGNWEIGMYIESADSNIVIGNYLGPDATGINALKVNDTLYQANGIELNTVAMHNVIGGTTVAERNIISGNRVYGMIYYGQTSENYVVGNYIGTDATGNTAMPNATGICLDAASNHNYIYDNVLSGNVSYGIFLVTNGTYYNEVKRNRIGTNAAGSAAIPNDVGLLIAVGARYNIVGGSSFADANVISGNRYEGIEVADNLTSYNEISHNYIGTDLTGSSAIPNLNGIGFASFPSRNTVDNNVISGNTALGIILYEYADSNVVTNNFIGTGADGISDLGNGQAGIAIANGASHNRIGEPGKGNVIAYNDSSGVVLTDSGTVNNTISGNSIFSNNYLGIEIFPPSVNENDAGDMDEGANNQMNFPVIISSKRNAGTGNTIVRGTLDTQNPNQAVVELFKAASEPLLHHGEGMTYLGSATPDAAGTWAVMVSGLAAGDTITATATGESGSTSEFSLNFTTVAGWDTIVGIEEPYSDFSLTVFPNPSSGETVISFSLHQSGFVELSVLDILGRTVRTLMTGEQPAGLHRIQWDGKDARSNKVASGGYVVRINVNEHLSNSSYGKVFLKEE